MTWVGYFGLIGVLWRARHGLDGLCVERLPFVLWFVVGGFVSRTLFSCYSFWGVVFTGLFWFLGYCIDCATCDCVVG